MPLSTRAQLILEQIPINRERHASPDSYLRMSAKGLATRLEVSHELLQGHEPPLASLWERALREVIDAGLVHVAPGTSHPYYRIEEQE